MRRPAIDRLAQGNRKETRDRRLAVSIGLALGAKALALALLYFAFFVPPAALAPLSGAVFGAPTAPGHLSPLTPARMR